MRQITQNLKSGKTTLEEVPAPKVGAGQVLIRTRNSLVSAGTERMLVEFGKANLVAKARQQPDKVEMVLDKIRAEGLVPTLEAVFNKLEQPLPLGYCNVGKVIAVGSNVHDFIVGDRVVSNGPHAEVVSVPQNLVAHIPENVSDEEATFTVIGAIGLQGIRLCKPTFGETIVVIGLGLIGLITVQLLKSNGCQVIGVDLDEKKCDLAKSWGVHTLNPSQGPDPVKVAMDQTQGIGADGVIITASAKSNDIISQAAQMSRRRGRIILVGVIGLSISRAEFYQKELTFQVSCSYGPGRYDESYEQKGIDYPIGFVRWTEKRNFEAILQAIDSGQLNLKELITEKVNLDDFDEIYKTIGSSQSIASLLVYPKDGTDSVKSTVQIYDKNFSSKKGVIGVIGSGNFTKMTMLPALKGSGAHFKYIASAGGLNGTALAKKFGFALSTTDHNEILNDDDVDLVLITTRHNSHSHFVCEALASGKNVFVEKPLALTQSELDQILTAYEQAKDCSFVVGFNRRFSPHIQSIKRNLGNTPGNINIIATMNAGFIPQDVWVHDMSVGGGRILGEACHYFDLVVYLSGSHIIEVCMNALGENPKENTDNASILLKMQNGSQAVINYFSNGAKSYSKERLEVYHQERTWVMDNFRSTKGYGTKGFKGVKTKIDKGHKAQFQLLIRKIQEGGEPLIPIGDVINVSKASFAAIQSLKENRWIKI